MKAFKLLILAPTTLPSVTGNAMTVERWRRSLVGMGIDVRVIATDLCCAHGLLQELESFHPDVWHVHNVYRSGGCLFDPVLAGWWARLPLVVTPSGTDVNLERLVRDRLEIVRRVLQRADVIVVQSEEGKARLAEIAPEQMGRVVNAPKTFVWLGEEPRDLRAPCGFPADGILFFMPAGIRPVKGNLECLLGLEEVRRARPHIKAVFAGPLLDGTYGERFCKEVDRSHAFARWIPAIEPAAMRSAYASADVVVNGSFSEGLSNVLLEGKAAGKPLLASDIPGNRWPVLGNPGDLPMGLLFSLAHRSDFVEKAIRLADDSALRSRLGEAGASYARRMPTPCDEARALVNAYKIAMESSPCLFKKG
jgi:glycosyltransferase involved in cell wall biosynthesis